MLRALGNQIAKTTNKEAMRDLSGRRMRDIKEEKKEAKLKKLHKLVTPGESKHEFHDQKYDEAREAATDRVHDAIDQVFNDPDLKPSVSGLTNKRKASDDKKEDHSVPVKRNKPDKGLW